MKLAVVLILISFGALAVNPGDKAIDFTLKDHRGKDVKLSEYKGKYVVLEWFNAGCPYVKKHYGTKNMQNTQKLYAENDMVKWITIVSSAEDKQGYLADAKAAMEQYKNSQMASDHLVLDPSGDIGRAYGAKTTPHIFIVDPKMQLAYVGAIDSNSSYKPETIKGATNYVTSSVSKLMLNEKPDPAKTKPYGCSVKY